MGAARNAAYQVNVGARQEWSNEVYYGAYQKVREKDGGEGWELLIGLRSNLPEEWAKFVNRAGSRKNEATEGEQAEVTGDPFQDDQEDAA